MYENCRINRTHLDRQVGENGQPAVPPIINAPFNMAAFVQMSRAATLTGYLLVCPHDKREEDRSIIKKGVLSIKSLLHLSRKRKECSVWVI